MEATDWLDEAVQQTKEKYQEQRSLEEEVLQQETLKRKLGSQFCREFFEWLETIDIKFNSKFGGSVLTASVVGSEGNRSIQVMARPIRAQERIAELNYQEDINCLGLSMGSGATNTTQLIRMVRSDGGEIMAEIGAERYTPVQLGQTIINDLLCIDLKRTVSRSQPDVTREPSTRGNVRDTGTRGAETWRGRSTMENRSSPFCDRPRAN